MDRDSRKEILNIIRPYLSSDDVQEMKTYIQHGNITTYRHVINVVKMAYILDKKFKIGADRRVLLTSALLHDFYGYDWHDKKLSELHGYRHPDAAANRARDIFDEDEKVQAAIRTHMWPFTLTKVPRSKEAWVLCIADKLSSMAETLWMRD